MSASAARRRATKRPIVVTVGHEYRPEFPADWMRELRRISPVSTAHSYLVPMWYTKGQRWVLYDALPVGLIDPNALYGLITGYELLEQLTGLPPAWKPAYERAREVSQVQWSLYRQYHAYCRPLWVLQGEHGGHQAAFTPWQQHLLSVKHLPMEPPPIGFADWKKKWEKWAIEDGDPLYEPTYLHPCPFDNRVIRQLERQNRLIALNGNLDALRKSANPAIRAAEFEQIQKDIRKAELAAVEQFMTPVVDMASTLHHRSDSRDHLIYMDGEGQKAQERLEYWLETGQYVLDPHADHPR